MNAENFQLDWHKPAETSIVVPMTVIAQMLDGITFDAGTNCWNFFRKSAMRDTPALSFGNGHTIRLDVLTLMFELDAPAPAGAHVLRSCGNPRCLAPYHLSWKSEDAGTSGDTPERTLHARAGAAIRYCEGLHS